MKPGREKKGELIADVEVLVQGEKGVMGGPIQNLFLIFREEGGEGLEEAFGNRSSSKEV